jgi:hypothetical protein
MGAAASLSARRRPAMICQEFHLKDRFMLRRRPEERWIAASTTPTFAGCV